MEFKMQKSFSISPRILSHLGEELIKNETIAILELVKNAYDACSQKCDVEFVTDNDENLKKIIISDNGFGMDRNIIENVWLTIGTDYKKNRITPNKCKRVPLGEKGIGRLGIHKLGNIIKVITKKENSPELTLNINWKLLNNVTEIDEFKVDIQENEKDTLIKRSGTIIIIENLKTEWTRAKIREV
jgi:HSP90 family molecular chaperone